MKVAVIGAGRIGGNCARQAVKGGHEVLLSFSRDESKLEGLASELGASVGSAQDAVSFGEIVILSVPWGVIPAALEQAGDFGGKVLVDTTNQFGPGPKPEPGQTDADAKQLVADLIEEMGYVPIDLGGTETCHVMEAPRRPGAVYGEEYRAQDAQAVVDAVVNGTEIPPTPVYQ